MPPRRSDQSSRKQEGAPAAEPQSPTHGRFAELYRTWRPTVTAAALAVLGSKLDAEDAAERVFARLWKNGGWWAIDHPASYFHRAGRLEALSVLRERPETAALNQGLVEHLADPSADPTRPVRRHELLSLVEDALDRFPERCREACELKWVRRLGHQRVAEELGITTKAVEKQLARGRRLLKEAAVLELLSPFVDGGE